MRLIWFALFLGFLPGVLGAGSDPDSSSIRQVVLVVWDGMRPDFVSAERTPALWKLAQEGVTFRNHHSVYLSATNVNGAALATGMYPAHTGLIANHEFRPEIDDRKPIDVENPGVITKADKLSHGHYIAATTVAELVQKAGGRSVVAAAKTVGLLHDRPRASGFANGSITLSEGRTWPDDCVVPIIKSLGVFPRDHTDRDVWTTRALTEQLWKDGVPRFSVLWLGQPDMSQHQTAPGRPDALRAIKGSDDNLAAVLSSLRQHQMADTTDVFVVSDHGFSTIARKIDVPAILKKAGFDVSTELENKPSPGKILAVGGGGSVLFYVTGHDQAVVNRLVEFLQQSDFAGVIFSREPTPGTFPLARAAVDSPEAPDVLMAFRWYDRPNDVGIQGMIDADWQRAAGKGTHATLSRFDMHNTLIAAGPDFRRGYLDELPSGNVDVAPTILKILGIESPDHMDGRILAEALANGTTVVNAEKQSVTASRDYAAGRWRQSLQTSRVGDTIYIDEGNGDFSAKAPDAKP